MNPYMLAALLEAQKGMRKYGGGPFGAVVVKAGKIIGRGCESVVKSCDPTAHAEIVAIKNACRTLKSHNLSGCTIYTTSEPCPMCMATIIESKIKKCYFGCALEDGFDIGFNDNNVYNILEIKHDEMTECIDRQQCLQLFYEYTKKKDKRIF